MNMTLCVPIMGELSDATGILSLLRFNTSDDVEFLIIDNGSKENVEEFFIKYIKPKKLHYIRNDENIGLMKTMQQAYENCSGDVLAVLHDDVYVYEKDWDKRILSLMNWQPTLGCVGFFGVPGIGKVGERISDVEYKNQAAGISNMVEAEKHGVRMKTVWQSVATLDGFSLIIRKELLDKTHGFDQTYLYHHYYDRDICLESLRHGYMNAVVNVSCHHLSGLTANRSQYQGWVDQKTAEMRVNTFVEGGRVGDFPRGDAFTHDYNARIFFNKWKDVLPLYVEEDGSFRKNNIRYAFGEYQGDAIRHMNIPS